MVPFPVETGRKLNVHKTFNLRPVSTGYLYLNQVLAETNEEINVASSALQTSFVDDVEESEGDEEEMKSK